MDLNNLLNRLTINSDVQHGKPCIKGTRTPAYIVLENLAMGLSIEEIKAEYPPLTTQDIQACIAFAAMLAKEEEILLSTS